MCDNVVLANVGNVCVYDKLCVKVVCVCDNVLCERVVCVCDNVVLPMCA